MERIERTSVLREIIPLHYDSIDWRLIDESGDNPVPYKYRTRSFITREQFDSYMARAFHCCTGTSRDKWKGLIADGIFIEQQSKKAFISLVDAKLSVIQFRSIRFDKAVYEIEKREKCEKNTQEKNVCEVVE